MLFCSVLFYSRHLRSGTAISKGFAPSLSRR